MLKDYYNKIDKRKFFIYLFSFLIFILINNVFLAVLSFLEGIEFNLCAINAYPCLFRAPLYVYAFQVYKIILFLGFIFCIRKSSESLLAEIFIAFFIYDLVFVLGRFFEILSPVEIFYFSFMLMSSPQISTLPRSLIIASIWTLLLMMTLWKFDKLSMAFIIKRLILIPFSVVVVVWMFYLIGVFR